MKPFTLCLNKLEIFFIDTYYKINAKIWMKKMHINNAWSFLKLSVKAFNGKIGVIDAREVYSKGGYKYYQMEVSVLPVDENADYSKI